MVGNEGICARCPRAQSYQAEIALIDSERAKITRFAQDGMNVMDLTPQDSQMEDLIDGLSQQANELAERRFAVLDTMEQHNRAMLGLLYKYCKGPRVRRLGLFSTEKAIECTSPTALGYTDNRRPV